MNHHPIADINPHMADARCVIGSFEENEIAGFGVGGGNRGADVAKALCAQPPDIPAGMIDDPAHEAAAIKAGAGGAAAPHIGIAQVFLCLRKHGGKDFIFQASGGTS